MQDLTLHMDISGMPAEFGYTYADMIKRLGTRVISGHIRKVNALVKRATPSRTYRERKLKDGSLNKQTKRYGTLRKSLSVKKLRSYSRHVIARYIINRKEAYWVNFLRANTYLSRINNAGQNRGKMPFVRDWIEPIVRKNEKALLDQINEANLQALYLAAKLTPQKLTFTAVQTGDFRKLKMVK